ncbi:MAG: DNA photolyase [Deltaproteobacteria bacterium]|jgi:spore photoproduct lyase|nr:DNA photolyase [Deltaproteobacteria bacterium]MBT4525050.1 DNA photolyase [Deltaproteobacteria bacterium]
MNYHPGTIYIDQEAVNLSFTKAITAQYPQIDPIIIDPREVKSKLFDQVASLTKGKQILYLKKFQGDALKLCPGYSDEVLCCNYQVIDLVENCPLECVYCILQAFLNKPIITFHVNVEEIIEKTIKGLKLLADRQIRVGTGEHSDSLALDDIFKVNPYLIDVFSRLKNVTLELKTKTDKIESLLGLNHQNRTVIAWSLNPEAIIKQYEYKTATLPQRIKAAQTVIDHGYQVAFHFDPMIYFEGWQKGYQSTIELLFDSIPESKIAWISLGTLRYIPALKQIAEERFPKLSIFSNEFIPAFDGKMRYLKSIRNELISTISKWIYQKSSRVPLYICMEKHSCWDKSMNCHPMDAIALEAHLDNNVIK